jgi:hypothetical protein
MSIGDINRDAPNDLVMLSPGAANGAGEMYVYYGRDPSRIGDLQPDGTRILDMVHTEQLSRLIHGVSPDQPISACQVFEVTGEGARDLIVSTTGTNSGAGAVMFTLSPKLRLSQTTITSTIGEGSPFLPAVNIGNPSPVQITWGATSSASWLQAVPSTGFSAAGLTGTVVLQPTHDLLPGTYNATVTIASTSIHLDMSLPVSVSLTVTESRFSGIASVSGSTVTQPFVLRGFALDKAASTGTGVDTVEIRAYPVGGGTPVMLGTATYGLARSDVAATYGARFANSGFEFTSSAVPAGLFDMVVRAHSTVTGTGWEKPMGTVRVQVQPIPVKPGNLSGDMDGDGLMDLVWQHDLTGTVVWWKMQGYQMVSGSLVARPSDINWQLRAIADVDGDGRPDLLWQHRVEGWVAVWLMNSGGTLREARLLNPIKTPDPNWQLVGASDLDGDGHPDLIWHHSVFGYLATWLMNGTTMREARALSPSPVNYSSWRLAGIGDINGDGRPDLIWQHRQTGAIVGWLMNGTQMTAPAAFDPGIVSDPDWQIKLVGDLDGDGQPDLLWQHKTRGYIAVWYLNGTVARDLRLLSPRELSDPHWQMGGIR